MLDQTPSVSDNDATAATRGLRDDGLRLGSVLGGTYRLLGLLGGGGMGQVYEAEHVRLGKTFAVKVLRDSECLRERTLHRFREEARALSAVASEHVVSVVDRGEDGGIPYLVMERLSGSDLRVTLQREGRMTAPRALRIMLGAVHGISAVHAAGLVHRDLKPSNLFLSRTADGAEHARILDFGVARSRAGNGTRDGALVGTLRYMAPEQLGDNARVGPHTDVYALGCILYECLAGEPPHAADNVEQLMFSILNHDPVPIAERCPGASPELCDLVAWAIARPIAARCPGAKQLAAGLRRAPELRAAALDDVTAFDRSDASTVQPVRRPRSARIDFAVALASVFVGVLIGRFTGERSDAAASRSTRSSAPQSAPAGVDADRSPRATRPEPSESTAEHCAAIAPSGVPVPAPRSGTSARRPSPPKRSVGEPIETRNPYAE